MNMPSQLPQSGPTSIAAPGNPMPPQATASQQQMSLPPPNSAPSAMAMPMSATLQRPNAPVGPGGMPSPQQYPPMSAPPQASPPQQQAPPSETQNSQANTAELISFD